MSQGIRSQPTHPCIAMALAVAMSQAALTGCSIATDRPRAAERQPAQRGEWTHARLKGFDPAHQIGWLNNETVLVIGYDKSKRQGLYAWNLQDRTRFIVGNVIQFCYDGKHWTALTAKKVEGEVVPVGVRYTINPIKLTATTPEVQTPTKAHTFPDPYTCKEVRTPVDLTDHTWEPLRPGDGFLIFEKGKDRAYGVKGFIATEDFSSIRENGIKDDVPYEFSSDYNEYFKEYVLTKWSLTDAELKAWNRRGYLLAWRFRATGMAQKIPIISGPWSYGGGADRSFHLMRPGLVVTTKAATSKTERNGAGYLIKPDQHYIQFDSGYISHLASSPDGCKIAYARERLFSIPTEIKPVLIARNLCTTKPAAS